MNRSTRKRIVIGGALAIVIAGCSPAPAPVADKAGGAGTPVVLRLGTDDFAGALSAKPIALYKAEVERLSGGLLKIEPVYQAVGNVPDTWDQRVAEAVTKGDLDLALIPARAFDALGVTSLQALQAPFLLTDDEVVDAVVTGDRVTDLLSGLPAIGISGLALWPDGLRHPVSFGDPILSLDDFRNLTIRAPFSRLSYDLLSKLGSKPVDLTGDPYDAGIRDGSVGAVETTIEGAMGASLPGVVTANITFFPKVNALVANPAALSRLSEEQRRQLTEAAATMTAAVVKTRLREADAATTHCASGGGLILATEADVEAIEEAAAPLYAELEKDPLTKTLIADFRALRSTAAGRAVSFTACEPEPSPSLDVVSGDQSVLDGIYRYEATEAYLLASGLDATQAHQESGVHTVTMADGAFSDEWTNAAGSGSCAGTFMMDGHRVTFRWTRGCFGDVSATYELVGEDVRWSEIEPLPPHNTPEDQVIQDAFMGVTYSRIADAP